MGGSGSTRRVVVENETGGVVSISEDVVRRLRGEPERERDTSGPARPPSSTVTRSSTEEVPYREERRIIRATDGMYEERLKHLEQKIQVLHETAIEQFASAVEATEKKFINQTPMPVCQDLQEFVLSCYRANPTTTLNCSQQVSAFAACVERARLNALSRRSQGA